jgi:hypothetical protein
MKKLLIAFIFLLPFLVDAQASIENGHVGMDGNFVFESKSELDNDFNWLVSLDSSTVNCYVMQDDEILDVLIWEIGEITSDTAVYRYTVTAHDGRGFILDFKKGGNSVIIFNRQTLQYSIMEGEGVSYE